MSTPSLDWFHSRPPSAYKLNCPYFIELYLVTPAYPELFANVGPKVPDFRGLFLRGVGGNSAVLGVAQNFATASTIQIATAYVDLGGVGWDGWAYAPYPQAGGGWTTLSGDIETRPVNKAVRYFVRAQP